MTSDERIITMLRGGLSFPVIAAVLGMEIEDVRAVVEGDDDLPEAGGGISYPRIHTFQAKVTTELPPEFATPEQHVAYAIGRKSTDGAQWSAEGEVQLRDFGFMAADSIMRVRVMSESFDFHVGSVKLTAVHMASGASVTLMRTGGTDPMYGPNFPGPEIGVDVPLTADSGYTPAGETQIYEAPAEPYAGVPITVSGMYAFSLFVTVNPEGVLPL